MKKSKLNNNFFGLNFIATSEETNNKYFLSETIVPAGDMGPPQHTHTREDESFYLKKGQLIFTVNAVEVTLSEGEFLNIEKGETHSWKNISSQDAELIVTFAPAGIEKMFVELDGDMSRIREIGLKYGTEFDI